MFDWELNARIAAGCPSVTNLAETYMNQRDEVIRRLGTILLVVDEFRKYEWQPDGNYARECRMCGGKKPSDAGLVHPNRDGDKSQIGHRRDCLVAALFKAAE